MIKLVNIIREIKVVPHITPEILFELLIELGNLWDGGLEDGEKWTELNRDLYLFRTKHKLYSLGDFDSLKTFSKNKLGEIYKDAKELVEKYKNINEIQIIPNATPEMVKELNDKIIEFIWDNHPEINEEFYPIRDGYADSLAKVNPGSTPFSLKTLKLAPKFLLNSIYNDFKQIEQKYNIK